jgi:uncharacterized protein YabN with tetrapyrrole methylase and pyrophosphatase domain
MNILTKLLELEHEASDFGFAWENSEQIMTQILSECGEVKVHLYDENKGKLQEEIGDLLHGIFSLCAFNKIDALETLTNSVNKFERRFRVVQQLAKEQGYISLNGESFEKLMELWDVSKKIVDP